MPIVQPITTACGTSAYEPNEQILKLMSNLGIDAQKTRESLKLNSYDHHAAIYLLLMERLKHRSMSQDGTAMGHMGKHPSLEQQKRRPSSIAEQAMRKLGLSHQRSLDPSISPRHHHMSTTVDLQSQLVAPLRESNIREPNQLRESAIFTPGGLRTATGYTPASGLTSNLFLNREREFINNPGGHSPLYPVSTSSTLTGSKESSTALIQKEIQSGISSLGISHRAPSNRLLSTGLDQRILKQSSEDCRRLLQQVIRAILKSYEAFIKTTPFRFYRRLPLRIPHEVRQAPQLPLRLPRIRWISLRLRGVPLLRLSTPRVVT